MRRSGKGGLVMALVLVVQAMALRPAAAAINPHVLALKVSAFPAGAFITHEHVDRTAKAVDAEGFVGSPSTQGNFYQRLHFTGSLFQSARLPTFQGASRELWLLATVFPSANVAKQALAADAHFSECDLSPAIPTLAGAVTCAYSNAQGPEAGMYVLSTVGRVEFIVVGFVGMASSAARARAIRDATYLALQEAGHVRHVLVVSKE